MAKHLRTMERLRSISFKKHKSSRFLPEFNATTNALLAAHKRYAKSMALRGQGGAQ